MQSADAESSVAATNAYSPLKMATSRSQASTPALLERVSSSTDLKKSLIAVLPKASVRRGGFKVSHRRLSCSGDQTQLIMCI